MSPPGRRLSAPRLAGAAAVVLLVAAFVATGLRGIDAGRQPDEAVILGWVAGAVESGVLLPRNYTHPSFDFALVSLCAAPDLARLLWQHRGGDPGDPAFIAEVRGGLRAVVTSDAYRLRARSVFVVVSALAIVWTYLLALAWRGRVGEAVVAAALLASSWEIAYHARWLRPDTILLQFTALCAWCLVRARTAERPARWLHLAAIAAGLGAGTKYPGAILLVPLLLTAWHVAPAWTAFRGAAARLVGTFFAAYLLTTPATLLEPVRFVANVLSEMHHYQLGHGGQTVNAGAEHLGLSLSYLATVLFSPYWLVSLAVAALAVVGAAAALGGDRRTAAALLVVPVLYVPYMAMQHVMYAHNLLLVAPFLAVFAGAGWGTLAGALPRPVRRAWAVPVLALVVVNQLWLVRAAESIRRFTPGAERRAAADYLVAHPATRLSPRMAREIAPPPTAVPAGRTPAVLAFASEIDGAPGLAGNRRGRFGYLPTGPFDLDYDYYPGRVHPDRIVIVDGDAARAMGVALAAPAAGGPGPVR